jgi:hypothetical protein
VSFIELNCHFVPGSLRTRLSFYHYRYPGADQEYIVHGGKAYVLNIVGRTPGKYLFVSGSAVDGIDPNQFGIDQLDLDLILGSAAQQGKSNNCSADKGFH